MKVEEREPTEAEIAEALSRPSDFGLSSTAEHADEMFKTWSLGPVIRTRDSNLLEESNADALERMLKSMPSLKSDWVITGCRHWAVGWVDHLSFRAIGKNRKPTKIFRVLCAWFDALSNYPCADEEDFSRREYEATLENIEAEGRRMVKSDVPEGWAEKCFSWFWENDQSAVESSDANGGYPSRDQMEKCLRSLGFFDGEP